MNPYSNHVNSADLLKDFVNKVVFQPRGHKDDYVLPEHRSHMIKGLSEFGIETNKIKPASPYQTPTMPMSPLASNVPNIDNIIDGSLPMNGIPQVTLPAIDINGKYKMAQKPKPKKKSKGMVSSKIKAKMSAPMREPADVNFNPLIEKMLIMANKKESNLSDSERMAKVYEEIMGGRSLAGQTDIGATMNFLDNQFGGNMRAGYKPPSNNGDDLDKINAMKAQQSRQAGSIANDYAKVHQLTDRSWEDKLETQHALQLEKMARQHKYNKETIGMQAKAKRSTANAKPLSQNTIEKVSAYKSVIESINKTANDIDKYRKFVGPVAGRYTQMNPYHDDARYILSATQDILQEIGKLKEGGVLRKEDEIKYRKMLGDITADPDVLIANYKRVAMELENKRNNFVNGLSSLYDIGGIQKDTNYSDSVNSKSSAPTRTDYDNMSDEEVYQAYKRFRGQ